MALEFRRALVVGASGGIGAAVAASLAAQGAEVTRLSRREDGIDITSEDSIDRALERLDPPFDLVFVATGMLSGAGLAPEKGLRDLTPDAATEQFRVNALGPVLVLKHALRLMPRRAPSVFAALSARVGSIGDNRLGGWYSYRSAKAALNQFLHGAAIEVARSHPQAICLALHPGTVRTEFTKGYQDGRETLDPAEAAAHLLQVIAARQPNDSGRFYDWRGDRVAW